MTILLLQTFLLLLLAFLLGASLACLIRRGLSGDNEATDLTLPGGISAAASAGGAAGLDTSRFERALVGGEGSGVPPVFHGQPVVEVQPRPAPPPPAPPAPAPVSKLPPAPPPADVPFTPVAPPRPPVQAPSPKPAVAEPVAPAPAPKPPVESERPTVVAPSQPQGPSYTEIAVAAAAAAAAQSQKPAEEAPTEAKAASYADVAIAAATAAAAAAQSSVAKELSYTEVAVAAAAQEKGEAAAPLSGEDDLTRIHAIDGELKSRLNRLGIHRFADIAAWKASDVLRLSQSLGFHGRIEQENWVGQAQILARGTDVPSARPREGAPRVEAAVPVEGERLHRIIGIDPKSEELLIANGVTRLGDVAGWTAADVARFEGLLGQPGRIERENWVGQARLLIAGAVPVVASAASIAAASAVDPAPSAPSSSTARTDYTGFRSVKSEALLGDAPPYVPPSGQVDDLKRIRGIGVLIEKKLHSLGITTYEQVANWTGADIERISQVLDFKGRIERENWIEQARILASGGQTEFSRRADRGEA